MGRGELVKHKKLAKHIKNVEKLSSASARTLLSRTRSVTKNGESNSNANRINSGVTGSALSQNTIIVAPFGFFKIKFGYPLLVNYVSKGSVRLV